MTAPLTDSHSIEAMFARLARAGEMALIPYWMAGYPTLNESIEIMRLLGRSGADLIEIGIPFSDPVADGATIQHAGHVALERGFRLSDLMEQLGQEPLGRPALIMSYLNPLEAYRAAGGKRQPPHALPESRGGGINRALLAHMQAARIGGLIVPDLPPEEAENWLATARQFGISFVFLVAPTTGDVRMRQIAASCDSFVYAVSLTGTTGARAAMSNGLPSYLDAVALATGRPVAVGFGISEPAHVRALRGHAAGVIVGSRLIDAYERGEDLARLMGALKEATRSDAHAGRNEG